MQTKRVWRKEEIQQGIETNDEWLRKGIVAIYNRQTHAEQTTLETKSLNGMGFNGVDARFLSAMAQNIQKGWTLTPKQASTSRRMMRKYCGQLVKIANGCL